MLPNKIYSVFSNRRYPLISAAVAIASVFCIVSVSEAIPPVVLVDTNGFESPTFGLGNLAGQDGWSDAGSGSTATVQPAVSLEGDQSLQVIRGSNSNQWWGDFLLGVPGAGSKIIQIQWDMVYQQLEQADHPDSFGPFIGVQANDEITTGSTLTLGTLGIDATTRDILVADGVSGAFKETGFELTPDEPHSFNLVLDFNSSAYTVFVDGLKLAQEDFVDNAAAALSDASIALLSAAADSVSQGLESEARIDNFIVTQGLAADFDDDGDVDADDRVLWEGAFGSTAVGDADGDGDSDGNDFNIWQQQFGIDLTSAPAVAAIAGVPEPSTVALAMCAAAGLAIRARRRRNG